MAIIYDSETHVLSAPTERIDYPDAYDWPDVPWYARPFDVVCRLMSDDRYFLPVVAGLVVAMGFGLLILAWRAGAAFGILGALVVHLAVDYARRARR